MGKGFAITTNLNLGEMLLAGYARHCSTSIADSFAHTSKAHTGDLLPGIRVAAITNDTVATLVSLAYAVKAAPSSRVAMGLIVGTGTNATVPMTPSDLHLDKQNQIHDLATTDTVVINTEWTIRGTDEPLEALEIKTNWDRMLDENSDAPGFQPFEYMTSGRYLGEIVRLAFVGISSTETNTNRIPHSLQQKNALPTRFLSEVVARSNDDTLQTQLATKFPSNEPSEANFWTPVRVQLLRALAQAVQQRSSALIAAASIGLLDCAGDIDLSDTGTSTRSSTTNTPDEAATIEDIVIAYTGSTISQYPHWLQDCQKWIDALVAGSATAGRKRVVLREAVDGGIIGAGVLAGMGGRIA